MTLPNLPNPFPGLRPFEPDEDHLFFGREAETDELVRRLRTHRFLSVIGTSGCGKSSLVRSGLIPSLESGLLVKAGSSWRIAILRPGEDPIGHLAEALGASHVLGAPFAELATTNEVVIEATLRRSTLGLVEAVRQAHLPAGDNVLVLVDQFEELFRFRKGPVMTSRDDAVAFVKLLLEPSSRPDLPIYIVVTMRSDFIGDCMDFPRLPEALNDSQYLVPRMTRDELRSAIAGPVAVAGAEITPRLLLRLLNDIGDDQDGLPLLQHVLMRTWDHWAERHQPKTSIDLGDYEAVGTLADALSQHAEEAYRDTGPGTGPLTTARIFKALTDTFSDPRGVRRPTSITDLAAICEVPEAEIIRIVEIFRRPGRSFLMPPSSVPLTSSTMIDLSHESLMRCWTRLMQWAREERQAAGMYIRLAREASFYEEGKAGLWADPQLELGLRWRSESHPTAAWARRYDETYERAIQFLDLSQQERERQRAERHAFRVRRLVLAWGTAGVMLVMSVVMFFFYLSARRQSQLAQRQSQLAEANLSTARNAVRQLLVSIDPDPATIGADVPQMQELRRDLLEQARALYGDFIVKNPGNDALASDVAYSHFRLGDMNRILENRETAVTEYRQAVAQYDRLAKAHPDQPEHRARLARTYSWLGETLRVMPGKRDEAQLAFDSALELQKALVVASPADPDYQLELARTHNNYGILGGSTAMPGEPAFAQAEADFREAIRRFTPLAESKPDAQTPQSQPGHEPVQNLARALNNLAGLVSADDTRLKEAASLTEHAVQLDEDLLLRQPDKREYKLELAKFANNLADLQRRRHNFTAAEAANRRAIDLLDDLMRPAPSLGIEHADSHDLRAHILQAEGSHDAVGAYGESLSLFSEVAQDVAVVRLPDFHQRFRDLLVNLGRLCSEQPGLAEAHHLLGDAADRYAALGERAVAAGQADGAHSVVSSLSSVLAKLDERDRTGVAKLDERDRTAVAAALARLQKVLRDRTEGSVGGEPPPGATTRKEI